MRYLRLSLLAFFAFGFAALGQQPVPQQPMPQAGDLNPATNQLDKILVDWESAMSSIKSLYTLVIRTSTDKVLLSKDTFEGEARYIKPNKASLYLKDVSKPANFEYLIMNGQTVYQFAAATKKIQVITAPPAKQGQVSDENFASMLFGMKATEAKKRWTLEFDKEDKYYWYINVLPKEAADKAEFSRARLVLTKNTNMPREIWFEMPNGNTTTWEFRQMQPNVTLNAKDFEQPTPPAGWQLEVVPNQERVVRPQK
jgi:TIGR03009 family protein